MSGIGPAGCWVTHKRLESWARAAKERALGTTSPKHSENGSNSTSSNNSLEEFNVVKEQPPRNASSHNHISNIMKNPLDICTHTNSIPALQHQSKSYPGGHPGLCRTPSVSSQSSIDSTVSRHGHRGSSPQIRTFAPDGRTVQMYQETGQCSSPKRNSRSPSPLRAASLDIRCSSPGTSIGEMRTQSPSQASLTSITSSICNSPLPISPKTLGNRCLSPLLLPTRNHTPDINAPVPPASPLGAIQPDLYVRKDGPMFLDKNPKSGPDLGRLHFRLKYDFDRSDLVVHLIEAHDLAVIGRGGFNDPYVRISIIPEIDTRKRQTIIQRNNTNPYFDQHFKFAITHEELQTKTLLLQVFDFDKFSRNEIVGEVRMGMNEFDVTSSIEVWGEISKNKIPSEELQEVLISLSYLPSAERLTVVVLKAKNLYQHKEKESIDPFVKVYLLVNGKRTKKKKTAVKKCCNPVWNEALTFTLSASNLPNAAIEVCVMDVSNDLIGSNPAFGMCTIGPKESGPERDHWLEITKSPRNTVAYWHSIRRLLRPMRSIVIKKQENYNEPNNHIADDVEEIICDVSLGTEDDENKTWSIKDSEAKKNALNFLIMQ